MLRLAHNKKLFSALTQTVLLAVLLHLCGHMFLHLGDEIAEDETTHIAAQSETNNIAPAAHHCLVCQDHQHLVGEPPAPFTLAVVSDPAAAVQLLPASYSFTANLLLAARAPPRG